MNRAVRNCRLRSRRAFSFAEVMFAVIILGVGFIMIAALFPVAIRQSKSNADETAAAANARGGANVVDTLVKNSSMLLPFGAANLKVYSFPTFTVAGAVPNSPFGTVT